MFCNTKISLSGSYRIIMNSNTHHELRQTSIDILFLFQLLRNTEWGKRFTVDGFCRRESARREMLDEMSHQKNLNQNLLMIN